MSFVERPRLRALVIAGVAIQAAHDLVQIAVDLTLRVKLERSALDLSADDLRHLRGSFGWPDVAVSLGVWIATIVLFAVWLHRAYRNLPALGATETRYTPRRAVTAWFIPFVNMVRPYFVLRELWVSSQRRAVLSSGEPLPRRASLVAAYWIVYAGSWVLPFLAIGSVRTFQDWSIHTWFRDASLLVYCVSGALLVAVVLGIDRRQREQWDELHRVEPLPVSDRLR